jgi:hypothetical protein
VYAVIRNDSDESILVLINLKEIPISDYSLNLDAKLLPDSTFTPSSLLDGSTASPLTVTGGMFQDYKPVPELPAYRAYIFQLK